MLASPFFSGAEASVTLTHQLSASSTVEPPSLLLIAFKTQH
jgi:hypothetical protein